jgi:hypothetical protein
VGRSRVRAASSFNHLVGAREQGRRPLASGTMTATPRRTKSVANSGSRLTSLRPPTADRTECNSRKSVVSDGHLAADACTGCRIIGAPFALMLECSVAYPDRDTATQMLALASGFCSPNVLKSRPPRGGYNPVGLRKVPTALVVFGARCEITSPLRAARLSGFARAHHYAAATRFCGRYACVEATAMRWKLICRARQGRC